MHRIGACIVMSALAASVGLPPASLAAHRRGERLHRPHLALRPHNRAAVAGVPAVQPGSRAPDGTALPPPHDRPAAAATPAAPAMQGSPAPAGAALPPPYNRPAAAATPAAPAMQGSPAPAGAALPPPYNRPAVATPAAPAMRGSPAATGPEAVGSGQNAGPGPGLGSPAPTRGAGAPAPRQGTTVLYPSLAVPGLADDVFWPNRSSPWPFSYDAIFRTAFAKSLPAQDPQSCQGSEPAGLIVARLQSELALDAGQMQLLQGLGGALGMAAGALAKACPPAVPAQPVARLRLMQAQVEALTMAIDLVRPPLQQFEQSLSAAQRATFAAAPTQSDGAAACRSATAADWPVEQIGRTVQIGDDQHEALADLRQAFGSAARDLDIHCPKMLPSDPLARLESIEARLDASWRAVLGMQVALASFESRLTQPQRARFEAMSMVEAQ